MSILSDTKSDYIGYGTSKSGPLLDQMNNIRAENNILRAQNNSLIIEKRKLEDLLDNYKNSPGIIGIVTEIIEDSLIVKGYNGVMFYTKCPKKYMGKIKIEDRVAMAQGNLAILKVLSEDKDYRATALELIEKPAITFKQIGGLKNVIREIQETVSLPLSQPEKFTDFGIQSPKGILIYGPPGTGKTLLAKAVANDAKATFISLSGSELIHKFIGEGAKVIKDVFALARIKKPAIIFIDEIDAVAAYRLDAQSGADREVHRTLMQLLVELDGFKDNAGVKVVAATNRIDILDEAILRPGRFDRIIEVPLPDFDSRKEILKIHIKNIPLAKDVDQDDLSSRMEHCSGADIEAICREGAIFAIRNSEKDVKLKYFIEAIEKVKNKPVDEKTQGNMFR